MSRFCIIALAAATLATPVLAEAGVKVSYTDLNLQSRSGAQVMLARINVAARRACGPAPVIRALGPSKEYNDCVNHAVGKAVAALNAPLVTVAFGGADATNRTVATVGAPR
jgi:UrcA family protein